MSLNEYNLLIENFFNGQTHLSTKLQIFGIGKDLYCVYDKSKKPYERYNLMKSLEIFENYNVNM